MIGRAKSMLNWCSALIVISLTTMAAGADIGTISTYAGGGPISGATPLKINVAYPGAVAVSSTGDVYFSARQAIYKLSAGNLTLIAGSPGANGYSGDGGPARYATFSSSQALAMDAGGNLYIADSGNQVIRKISASTGIITTIAGSGLTGYTGDGGPAKNASFFFPNAVAVDSGGSLYITDSWNHVIRKVASGTGFISTFAGLNTGGGGGYAGDGGPATAAKMLFPSGLALDSAGLYIADSGNHRIRRVELASGIITTVAGNGIAAYAGDGGPAIDASLSRPFGVAVGSSGTLFIADTENRRVRKVSSGVISTVATSISALYNSVAVFGSSDIYVSDSGNSQILRSVGGGPLSVIAGSGIPTYCCDGGPATSASLASPYDLAADRNGNVYIVDLGNSRIRKVAASTEIITTVAGDGVQGYAGDNGPAVNARLAEPHSVAVDSSGNLYIADTNNQRVRRVEAASGLITTVAGTGTAGFSGDGGLAIYANLNNPSGVAVDSAGNVFIADGVNNRIRKIAAATGVITTVAGNGIPASSGDGGLATDASIHTSWFPGPGGRVAVDQSGNLYITEFFTHRVRKVDGATGIITTIAGNGSGGAFSGDGGPATAANLMYPADVDVDASGNLYIADQGNLRVRVVSATTGIITTLAGTGIPGFAGDAGPATGARFASPMGVALSNGRVYVSDSGNNRIRQITPANTSDKSFVRGSGSIDSPPGAYPSFPGASGPATFNLDAKYRKGVPEATIQFTFQGGNLTFLVSAMDWWGVTGRTAKIAGAGSVNGSGAYRFLLTALDGGGGSSDYFRIKIWDPAWGDGNSAAGVIYDNQLGMDALADPVPAAALTSGRLQVQSKK